MLDRDAIKARLAAATRGPWRDRGSVIGDANGRTVCDMRYATSRYNKPLILHAAQDIAALLEALERAEREIERCLPDGYESLEAFIREIVEENTKLTYDLAEAHARLAAVRDAATDAPYYGGGWVRVRRELLDQG